MTIKDVPIVAFAFAVAWFFIFQPFAQSDNVDSNKISKQIIEERVEFPMVLKCPSEKCGFVPKAEDNYCSDCGAEIDKSAIIKQLLEEREEMKIEIQNLQKGA